MHYHKTWRAALLAAGLPGGRPPLELSLNERIEATLRMRTAGLSVRAIAAELGVNEYTPFTYLHARLCDCGRNYTVNGPRCTQCAGESTVRSEQERGKPHWTADTVIAAIHEWARLEGRAPRYDEWASGRHASGRWRDEYPRWPPAGTVQRLHGSWAAALSAAGHSPAWRPFTDQEVIDALRADAGQLGRAPLRSEWQQRPAGTPGFGAVISHFGTWNRGLRAAGVRVPYERGRWTRERVIRELQRDAQKRGRTPSSGDWSKATRTHPVAGTVDALFGTWNAALRAAGLPPNREPGKWTPTKVLDALRQLEQELGRQPISTDVRTPPAGYPSRDVIKRTLGSWRTACQELGWSAPRRVHCDEQQMITALRAAAVELGSGFALQTYKATSGDRGWPSAQRDHRPVRHLERSPPGSRAPGTPPRARLEPRPTRPRAALTRPTTAAHPDRSRMGSTRLQERLATQRHSRPPTRRRIMGTRDRRRRPDPTPTPQMHQRADNRAPARRRLHTRKAPASRRLVDARSRPPHRPPSPETLRRFLERRPPSGRPRDLPHHA